MYDETDSKSVVRKKSPGFIAKYWKWILGALIIISGIIGFTTWLFFMYTVAVEPGEEVVLVDRPYIFKSFGNGVRPEPIKEGRELLFVTTKAFSVSVVPVSKPILLDDFSTKDRFLLDFESNIQYRVINSVSLIDRFGSEWFENNIQHQYLGIVRTVLRKHEMRDVMASNDTVVAIDDEITDAIRALVKDHDLPIEIINITLGRAKPNPEVLAQMNRTAAEKECEMTISAQEETEKKRETSEEQRAIADNAYRNKMGMSTNEFVALQIADKYAEACKVSTNCVIINGNSNVAIPVK